MAIKKTIDLMVIVSLLFEADIVDPDNGSVIMSRANTYNNLSH